jgi:hypothetical protein
LPGNALGSCTNRNSQQMSTQMLNEARKARRRVPGTENWKSNGKVDGKNGV